MQVILVLLISLLSAAAKTAPREVFRHVDTDEKKFSSFFTSFPGDQSFYFIDIGYSKANFYQIKNNQSSLVKYESAFETREHQTHFASLKDRVLLGQDLSSVNLRALDDTRLFKLNSYYRADCSTMAEATDYRNYQLRIGHSRVNPSGTMLGVIQVCYKEEALKLSSATYGRTERVRLLLVSAATGKIVRTIDNVRQFEWVADDKLIVSNAPNSPAAGELRLAFCVPPMYLGEKYNVGIISADGKLIKALYSVARSTDNCREKGSEWLDVVTDLKAKRALVVFTGPRAVKGALLDLASNSVLSEGQIVARESDLSKPTRYTLSGNQVIEQVLSGKDVTFNAYGIEKHNFGTLLKTSPHSHFTYNFYNLGSAIVYYDKGFDGYVDIDTAGLHRFNVRCGDGGWSSVMKIQKVSERHVGLGIRCGNSNGAVVMEFP